MKFIIVPGINNSGANHWQTIWERNHPQKFIRVQQENWYQPEKNSWVTELDRCIRNISEPIILVAHSLGCITVVHWAGEYFSENVTGAFLVAPADVEKNERSSLRDFAPVPRSALSFPSIVVASTNDPYAKIHQVAEWSQAWESDFVNIGAEGHINADSQLGNWDQGFDILEYLERTATVHQLNEFSRRKAG